VSNSSVPLNAYMLTHREAIIAYLSHFFFGPQIHSQAIYPIFQPIRGCTHANSLLEQWKISFSRSIFLSLSLFGSPR
jgi:hypothetical protein